MWIGFTVAGQQRETAMPAAFAGAPESERDSRFPVPGGRGRAGRLSAALLALLLTALTPLAARANAVTDWNTELQQLIRLSSANLVAGPPEVAREMAIVTGSMFDAVNACSSFFPMRHRSRGFSLARFCAAPWSRWEIPSRQYPTWQN